MEFYELMTKYITPEKHEEFAKDLEKCIDNEFKKLFNYDGDNTYELPKSN